MRTQEAREWHGAAFRLALTIVHSLDVLEEMNRDGALRLILRDAYTAAEAFEAHEAAVAESLKGEGMSGDLTPAQVRVTAKGLDRLKKALDNSLELTPA